MTTLPAAFVEALVPVLRLAAAQPSVESLLDPLLEAFTRLVAFDDAGLLLPMGDGASHRFLPRGGARDVTLPACLPGQAAFVREVARRRAPFLVGTLDDVDDCPASLAVMHALGHTSALVVPILVEGSYLGALAFFARRANGFTAIDPAPLEAGAALAGLAVQLGGAREQLGRLREQLGRFLVGVSGHLAEARSLPATLAAIAEGLGPALDAVLARVWLVGPGDRCARCTMAGECHERTRCLHLEASAGLSRATTGQFARFPLGARRVGEVAVSGQPVVRSAADDAPLALDVADADWLARHGVRGFAALPLEYAGERLGVLAVFTRRGLGDDERALCTIAARHAAIAIATARAFAELDEARTRLAAENAVLQAEIREDRGDGPIVGVSPARRRLLDAIEQVADADVPVLVHGETGTGKELVARALHDASHRRARPLVKVNCAAVPRDLFEATFFGHARGAFTGALRDQPGRFEVADGGTIFLDEVGEIPLDLQPKLLRVLQEKELERVGEARTRAVDVRVVAATNRDLAAEVAAGRFREDLYFRLSVFPIEVPPLRERREDIPLLARHFAVAAARATGRRFRGFDPLYLEHLTRQSWPGNVRELKNRMERAVVLSRDGVLRDDAAPAGPPAAAMAPAPAPPLRLRSLAEIEREAIEQTLAATGGKLAGPRGAAAALGLPPSTLASRMKKLGVRRPGA